MAGDPFRDFDGRLDKRSAEFDRDFDQTRRFMRGWAVFVGGFSLLAAVLVGWAIVEVVLWLTRQSL